MNRRLKYRVCRVVTRSLLLLFIAWRYSAALAQEVESREDWPQFRGPSGAASGPAALTAEWNPNAQVRWRRELPGPGGSSPVVVGNQVFLTAYSGYGVDELLPGDSRNLVRHLVCINRRDGQLLWQ